MTIIEQLEQSVSLPLLGAEQNIAHISLLEQFYALLIARLALPKVYTRLLQATHQPFTPQTEPLTSAASTAAELSTANPADSSWFSQLWQDPDQRQLITDELAATHHLDKSATAALITSASALAYHELKGLANGQFLPAFLQQQQSEIRHYLPVWAESVLIEAGTENGSDLNSVSLRSDLNSDEVAITTEAGKPISTIATVDASEQSAEVPHIAIDDSAHSHSNSHSQFRRTRKGNNKHDLLWRLLLLVAAIAALALVWVLVIQPNYISTTTTAEPISVDPDVVVTEVVSEPEPVAAALTPVELLIAVDNSGRLYTCNGIAGSANLQDALSQALVRSFGEQASICELQLKSGVADSLTAVDIELLPSLFTLLKSAPFARLQLQNDMITIESPDESLSQRLLTDMRALAPAANMTTNASFSAIENTTTASEEGELLADNFEWQNEAQENDSFNTQSAVNDSSNNDNANPNGNNTVSSNTNNNANNSTYNSINPNLNTNPIANTGAIGGMSTAEVDDLANSVIVAERLDNESRVELDTGSN